MSRKRKVCEVCETNPPEKGLYLCRECFQSLVNHLGEIGSPDPEQDARSFACYTHTAPIVHRGADAADVVSESNQGG